jgi:periplasmic copper chaperone A
MLSRLPSLIVALLVSFLSAGAAAEVAVSDAWVRGTVAGQMGTGAFMRLTSSADTTLVGVASPAAKVVELHQMKMEGSMMKMSAIARLSLPAGKTVLLEPRGYHVMLMDLARPLKEGDIVPLSLTFEDKTGKKQTIDVKATVRALGK